MLRGFLGLLKFRHGAGLLLLHSVNSLFLNRLDISMCCFTLKGIDRKK
jgi:hypothetical protein